jgi:ribosome biogenesis GTPase A
MKQIHWYPGHMKKAQIEVQERLKLVDVIVELLDARIPISSRNDVLYKITKDKLRLVVLTKTDLADKKETEKWINSFKNLGFSAIFADLNKPADVKNIVKEVEKLGENKNQKFIAKGMKAQPVRAMIIGIPNVGKSTLINKISGRHAASVQNKPGHTKAQQWIKVSNKFELLDTPGILPPSYDDPKKAVNLALVGSVNAEILPNEDLAKQAFDYVKDNYPEYLKARFEYLDLSKDDDACFEEIAYKRGYFTKGGQDIEKAYKVFLNEVKNGLLGKITFERV